MPLNITIVSLPILMGDMLDSLGKGLHFMHLNVRSILAKNKFDMLKVQIANSKLNVFTISESWLNPKIPNSMIAIPGYSIIRSDRPTSLKARGGGLVTYISNEYNFDDSTLGHLDLMTANIELQCIRLIVPNIRQIFLINLYRPPQGSIPTFIEKLNDTLSKILKSISLEILTWTCWTKNPKM